jgi:hypothetical protein
VVRKIGCLLTLVALATACGGPNAEPTQETLSDTPSISATPSPDVVGEWLRARTCEELVEALTQAGFKDFAPSLVETSGTLGKEPVKDPENPCADARGPIRRSIEFVEDGTFNAYDPYGRPIDYGHYGVVGTHSIGFAGFKVGYDTDGDSIAFQVMVRKSCTFKDCRQRAAYVISVFYPGKTWKRLS